MNKDLSPFQPQEPRKCLVLPPSVSISYQLQTAAKKQHGSSHTNGDRSFTITGEIRSPNKLYQLETLVTDTVARRTEGPLALRSVLEVSATNSVCVITRRESGNDQTQEALQIPLKDGPFSYSYVSFNKPRSEADGCVHPVDFFVRFRVLCWLFNNQTVSWELGQEGPFRIHCGTECQPSVAAIDLTPLVQMNAKLLDRSDVSQRLDSYSARSLDRRPSNPTSQKGYRHEDPPQHGLGFINPSLLIRREPSSDVVGVPKMTASEGIEKHSQSSTGLKRRNQVRRARARRQGCHLCPFPSCRQAFRHAELLKR